MVACWPKLRHDQKKKKGEKQFSSKHLNFQHRITTKLILGEESENKVHPREKKK